MSTVWGTTDVEAAASRGVALRVAPGDVVTPLARDRAHELGVAVTSADAVDRPPPATALPVSSGTTDRTPGTASSSTTAGQRRNGSDSPAPSPATPLPPTSVGSPGTGGPVRTMRPPSPALFRRGAPLPAGLGGGAWRTGRAVVIGAGHVGMITGMRLADADVFDEVVLVDIDEGRAAGIALDLQHTAPLSDFATRVRGVGTVEEAGPADYVVITAGRARQPGMTRADLVSTNAEIVGDLARRVAATSPQAVIIVVTNPLDEMTQHAWTSSGFPSSRVLGMAGVLDTARFQALVGVEGSLRARAVDAIALGSHGEEMVIPLSRASHDGSSLAQIVPPAQLNAVVDRARGSGAEVVGLLKTGSAFMAPGMSAARMVLAMVRDSDEVMSAAVLADGSYGIRGVYVGLPVRLGRGGLREIVTIPLGPEELAALREAGERIRARLGAMAAAS